MQVNGPLPAAGLRRAGGCDLMHLPGAGAPCNVGPGTRQDATPEPTGGEA